ncbi:MAG TPA: hypothetical protein VJB63_02645 [Patescibacteria group bacterium]|nr:hypothetical protein [Patescibacteria group bacterium]
MISFAQLIKKALHRTKERFLIYIQSLIFYILVFILYGLGLFFILESSQFINRVLAVLFFLGAFFLYFFTNFLSIVVLIDERKQSFYEAIQKSLSYSVGYLWFSALSGLFLFGLIPVWVLSFFVTLLLWSVWSMFAVFIFIEQRTKGWASLWISREVVKQRLWYVVRNAFLIIFPALLVSVGVTFFSKNDMMQIILSFFYGVFLYPLVMSFYYELYKTLPYRDNVKISRGWVIVSVIGWIIIVGFVFISIFFPVFFPSSDIPCVNTETIRCLPS